MTPAPTSTDGTRPVVVQDPALVELGINVVRGLAMDAPEKANSGHSGTAMALAPLAHVLWTRIMRYDPRRPHEGRYVRDAPPLDPGLEKRIIADCLTLNRALGYDLNTVEFAVRGGIPYAIDFLNPAPDADINSVGPENFAWVVNAVAEMAVRRVTGGGGVPRDYLWSEFLGAPAKPRPAAKPASAPRAKKR